jgi:hypothetical protein
MQTVPVYFVDSSCLIARGHQGTHSGHKRESLGI